MDRVRAILVLISLFPTSVFASECTSKLINWTNFDDTISLIQTAYDANDFSSVDQALSCLHLNKRTFTSGKLGSAAVYWFYRSEFRAPGGEESDQLKIASWKKAVPGSNFASFADIRFSYQQAWNARGSKTANETKADQFKRFKQKLLETEQLILSDDNKLKDSPVSYNLLLAVTLDTDGTQHSPMDAFHHGVATWPNYYDFYEVLLSRLVPKWGGSWERVDQFIDYYATNLKESEENTIYARFYYNVHKHNRIDPRTTLASWTKLKPSLVNLYKKYPAREYLDLAASYACTYGDKDFYDEVVYDNKIVTSKYWINKTSKEACDAFFHAMPSKSSQGAA